MQLPPLKQTFVKPENLLKNISLKQGMTVADFGCGSGHYTVAAAAQVGAKGQVYALDVQEEALSHTATHAKLLGLHNVSTKLCDLEKFGSCPVPETSCDLVILGSVLHQVQDRDNVLRYAYRVLKTGGWLVAVEWLPDAFFGPPQPERISKEVIQTLIEKFSFRPAGVLPAGSFHYALLYQK